MRGVVDCLSECTACDAAMERASDILTCLGGVLLRLEFACPACRVKLGRKADLAANSARPSLRMSEEEEMEHKIRDLQEAHDAIEELLAESSVARQQPEQAERNAADGGRASC